MNTLKPSGPQGRILDAAEKAFAEGGYDGASLRQIVQEAKVNLATVYYYFRSKEGLMTAVFERRLEPLRAGHLEALRRAEAEAGGRPLPVETILQAMLLPPLRLAASDNRHSQAIRRLIGRLVTEPSPRMQKLLTRQRNEVRNVLVSALRRSLPHLPERDLQWRFEFVWGALAQVLCNPAKVELFTDGVCNPADTKTVLAQMIQFFAVGFKAPATT